jgi:hypothetical protein
MSPGFFHAEYIRFTEACPGCGYAWIQIVLHCHKVYGADQPGKCMLSHVNDAIAEPES